MIQTIVLIKKNILLYGIFKGVVVFMVGPNWISVWSATTCPALYTQVGQYVSAHHCPLALISGNARIGTTDGTDYHG